MKEKNCRVFFNKLLWNIKNEWVLNYYVEDINDDGEERGDNVECIKCWNYCG